MVKYEISSSVRSAGFCQLTWAPDGTLLTSVQAHLRKFIWSSRKVDRLEQLAVKSMSYYQDYQGCPIWCALCTHYSMDGCLHNYQASQYEISEMLRSGVDIRRGNGNNYNVYTKAIPFTPPTLVARVEYER